MKALYTILLQLAQRMQKERLHLRTAAKGFGITFWVLQFL